MTAALSQAHVVQPAWGAIPAELRALDRWVSWRVVGANGDVKKLPVDIHTGALARCNDAGTWAGFDAVRDACTANPGLAGAWFALGAADEIGIDMDGCRDPESGAIEMGALDLADRLRSYTEISPSGRGLHILIRGSLDRAYKGHLPGGGAIEVYARDRFFAMTGRVIPGCDVIEPRQAELDALIAELRAPARAPASTGAGTILAGKGRNNDLTAFLGRLRRLSLSENELTGAGLAHTHDHHDPPLSDAEVRGVARSVAHYPPAEDAPRAITFHTAAELAALLPERPAWLVDPYIARGVLTELDGKPKKGKTTWMLALLRSILLRLLFLGRPTCYAPIVYLTEERGPTFREALARAGLLDRTDLSILSFYDAAGVPWPDIVLQVRAECARIGAGLLVIDTLSKWARLRDDTENQSGTAEMALEPLQQVAHDLNLAVLVARHERKSGGEVGDSARGSNAFTGGVDIVLQLLIPQGQQRPTIRVLNAVSRFDSTPPSLVIERIVNAAIPMNGVPAETFCVLGTGDHVAGAEASEALRRDLPGTEDEAISLKDFLSAHPSIKRSVLQAAIEQDTTITRTGKGRKGDPQRYFRPLIDSAERHLTEWQKGRKPS